MNIITGRTGQPHVTSQQVRDTNSAVFGSGDCVLNVGRLLEAEKVGTNTIRIFDGQLSMQGCIASIEAGEYDDVTIQNGTIGKQRYDLIAAHYSKTDSADGQYVENVILRVIKGTDINYLGEASSVPSVSSVADSVSIRDGAIEYDFPLYKIHIQELDIVSIEPLFEVTGYDTGWQNVQFSQYFKNSGEETMLQYRRIGSQVEIRGDITPTQSLPFSAYADYPIGYIPKNCAPSKALTVLCQGTNLSEWMLSVSKDGVLSMSRMRQGGVYKNLELKNWSALHIMYFVG